MPSTTRAGPSWSQGAWSSIWVGGAQILEPSPATSKCVSRKLSWVARTQTTQLIWEAGILCSSFICWATVPTRLLILTMWYSREKVLTLKSKRSECGAVVKMPHATSKSLDLRSSSSSDSNFLLRNTLGKAQILGVPAMHMRDSV